MSGWGEPKGDTSKKNQFEDMDPKEINFITHPFWRELFRQIEQNQDFAYSITQDGKPVAVIISAEAMERARDSLETLERLFASE